VSIEQRREEEREERRRTILNAAIELYAARGVDQCTLGDIAQRARLSRGLIYFYFGNGDGLFYSVVAQGLSLLAATFRDVSSMSDTGLKAVEAIGRAYLSFASEHRGLYNAIARFQSSHEPASMSGADHSGPSPELSLVFEKANELNTILAECVRRGTSDGSIRTGLGDELTVALVLWFETSGLVNMISSPNGGVHKLFGLNDQQIIDAGLALLRSGLERR
jgi:AcrR family transcriptional regulator